MKMATLAGCLFALGGCAELFLDNAERPQVLRSISASEMHLDVTSLNAVGQRASRLAFAYIEAAENISYVQDSTFAIVLLSAGATAAGLASEASNEVLANRALPGLLSGASGRRYASKETITAIYAGAQRLNCISAKASIADAIGEIREANDESAAVAATRSAIIDAQIMTRADVARENAEFKDLFDEISGGLQGTTTGTTNRGSEPTALTAYIAQLQSCLSKSSSPQIARQVVQPRANPDIPEADPEANDLVAN